MKKTIVVLVVLSISLYSGGNTSSVDLNSTANGFYNEYPEQEIYEYPKTEQFDENQINLSDTNLVDMKNKKNDRYELIQESEIELGGDELGRNLLYARADSVIDLRGFYFQDTSECKSLLISGVLEIKNKNLDYDKNQVFLRHGRITYVVPTTLSIKGKKCFIKKTKRGDILNMNKLMKYIGK